MEPESPHLRISVSPRHRANENARLAGRVSASPNDAANDNLRPARRYIAALVALLAAVTCTFGNLAAYGQSNIKRLLAYSTIAHAGFMMMPVAAAIALLDTTDGRIQAEEALAAVPVYVGVYLFMNLGAFAVVAFLRNAMRTEAIADYSGLIRQAPFLVICFSIILLSLFGLPPLAGFVAKFWVFMSLAKPDQPMLLVLLGVGTLNTVLSLVYYLRVVKTMALDPEPDDRLPVDLSEVSFLSRAGVYVGLLSAAILVLGVWWESLNGWALAAARDLVS